MNCYGIKTNDITKEEMKILFDNGIKTAVKEDVFKLWIWMVFSKKKTKIAFDWMKKGATIKGAIRLTKEQINKYKVGM